MPYRPNIGFDNIERWFGVSWFGIHAMGLGRAAQELGGMPTFWWGLMKPNAKKISEEVRPQTAYRCLEDVIGCKWSVSALLATAEGVVRPGAIEEHIPVSWIKGGPSRNLQSRRYSFSPNAASKNQS